VLANPKVYLGGTDKEYGYGELNKKNKEITDNKVDPTLRDSGEEI